jgi:DNA-binding NarL/FixJ family response regulator
MSVQVFLVRVEDAGLDAGDVAAAVRSWCGSQVAGVAVSEQDAGLPEQMYPVPNSGPLAPAQLWIMSLVASGVTRRDLAARTGWSARTIQAHLSDVYRRLGIDGLHGSEALSSALLACLRLGLVRVDRAGAA